MTTVDKLFVLFYERKHSIIELVKERTELYGQHIASKLLIDGITPPSWLWDPNTSGSKELNNEDLISKFLPPYPQPSACCSFAHYPAFNNLIITGDNEEFSNRDFVDNPDLDRKSEPASAFSGQDLGECAFNTVPKLDATVDSPEEFSNRGFLHNPNLDRKSDPASVFSGQDLGECAFNTVPELDATVDSPGDQTDGRILNVDIAPDQSLVGIQRSKSRQKALELRSSAKALAKSGLRHEITSDISSSHIKFSLPIINLPGQNDEPSPLAEPRVIGRQSCEDRNGVEARCISREMGADSYSERITRSGSCAEVLISDKGSLPLDCSSENYKENDSSQDARSRRIEPMPLFRSEHADNHLKRSPKSVGPSAFCCQNFRDIGGSPVKVNLSNVRNEGCDAQESVLEDFGKPKEMDTFPSLSSNQLNACRNDISDLKVPSVSAKVHRQVVALSTARSARHVNDSEELPGLVKPSVGLFRRLTRSQTRSYEKETYHPVTDKKKASLVGTISISDFEEKSSQELQAASSRSADNLPQKISCSLHVRDASLVKGICGENNQPSSSKQLLRMSDVSSLEDKAYRHSLEPDYQKSPDTHAKSLGPVVGSTALSASKDSIEAELNVKPSEVQEKTDDVLSEKVDITGIQIPPAELHIRSPGNFPEKMRCSLHVRDASLGKGICGENNDPSSIKHLLRMSDVSSEQNKVYRHSLEPDYQKSPDTHAKKLAPIVGNATVDASTDSTEAELNVKSSEVQDEADDVLSEKVDITDIQTPQLELHTRSPDNLPQNTSCSLHVRDASLVKGICGENNQPSSSKQLLRMSDVSSEENKVYRDSLEPDCQKSPDTHAKDLGVVVGSATLNASKDSTTTELKYRSSEFQDKTENLSEKVHITDFQIPPAKLHIRHGLESSLVHCMEQGDCRDEGREEGQLVSSFRESQTSRFSYGHSSGKDLVAQSYDCLIMTAGTNPIEVDEIKQDTTAPQSQMLSWPEGEVSIENGDSSHGNNSIGRPSTVMSYGKNSSLERRSTHARIESCPQAKRRKSEVQQAHSFTTSQSFQVSKHQSFQRDPGNMDPKTMEINVGTGLMEHVNKDLDDGSCTDVNTYLMEGIQSALLSQHVEVGYSYIEKNEHRNASPIVNNEQLVATISNLAIKESRNSGRCSIEGKETSTSSCDFLDARKSVDKQCGQHLCNLQNDTENLNSEHLDLCSTLHKDLLQFPKWENGLDERHSVLSSSNEDLQLTDIDQSMPVLEGFNVNEQTDTGELDFAADGFNLGQLELPRTTLERASILAEICRSASLDKPSSHFSSAFKFQETWNFGKSVPDDGHLEHMEFGNIYPLNPDIVMHFKSHSNSLDDCKNALDGMPYSVSLANSGKRYGWNSRNQPLSPVRKLWDQLSSHTGSSGKCSTSNPELTCFPIEEDPSSSEDNKIMEEDAGDTQDETNSLLSKHSDKRQPLKDLTNLGKNPLMPVSAEEGTSEADSVDFLSSKLSVTGTQEEALLDPKYQHSEKNETSKTQISYTGDAGGRKYQISSIAPSTIKKTKHSVGNSSRKSLNKRTCKPIMSTKTSLKGRDQKLSLKESRWNNIVSNVSSFIPLVQQKQAATECTGKRDVKVKSLEAAEAAKRLEERKENERKMRKEALKVERAKLEEKNLRDMELEKKKKDEERKKKDADIIAKKRLREEEERKEKEKKKMRLEVRQRQREKEEKKRKERPEKENQQAKDDQIHRKKECNNESKRQQNKETTNGEGTALTETNLNLNKVEVNHEECSSSGLSCEAREVMHAVDKSPRKQDLIVQNCQGKSYEISPYQCSDDEVEEDDELPTKKYIPSWASKSSIALYLPLQQELDPHAIFPLDSFRNLDAVLLPRKLQQKQVDA